MLEGPLALNCTALLQVLSAIALNCAGFGKANANTDIVRIAAKVIVIIVFLYTLR